jgi:hypothetical protein
MKLLPDLPARALTALLGLALPLTAPATDSPGLAGATGKLLKPYKARYKVGYKIISGGEIEASLRPGEKPGVWIYESRAFPNILGRVIVSSAAVERSTMEVTPQGVRPLTLDFNDGSDEKTDDIHTVYDWSANRVHGEVNGAPFAQDIEPGTQDTASVQATMIIELNAGRTPTGFPILTGEKLRNYRYWLDKKERVSTPIGDFDAEVWASTRDGSKRTVKIWHVPELGYIPVKAVQFLKDKPQVNMEIVSLERG